MRIGSLFSGIGGLELGLERAGVGHTVWQCEIDPYARAVLAKHWPHAVRFDDITKMEDVPPVDLICGGFPCQDISNAGRREGITGARSGLFYELMRVVRLVRPRFVVLENVAALLGRGMGDVLGELSESGFDAEWDCVPASAVGAPHQRDRVFIVGYVADAEKLLGNGGDDHGRSDCEGGDAVSELGNGRRHADVADAARHVEGRTEQRSVGERTGARGESCDVADADEGRRNVQGIHFGGDGATAVPIKDRAGRLAADLGDSDRASANALSATSRSWRAACQSGRWLPEPDVGRVAHGVPSRVDRLKCLGNAVVPQVAEVVGRRVMELCAAAHCEALQ